MENGSPIRFGNGTEAEWKVSLPFPLRCQKRPFHLFVLSDVTDGLKAGHGQLFVKARARQHAISHELQLLLVILVTIVEVYFRWLIRTQHALQKILLCHNHCIDALTRAKTMTKSKPLKIQLSQAGHYEPA